VPEQYDTSKQNICQPELVKDEKKKIVFRKQTKNPHPNGQHAQATKKEIRRSPL